MQKLHKHTTESRRVGHTEDELNETVREAERAKTKQKDVFNFYGIFVSPLSVAYDNFFARPENQQILESFK